MKNLVIYLLLIVIVLLSSCSSERNTWTSKAYHNTTAHYNGYYYAREELEKVEATIRKSYVDDYNRILRLFPPLDSSQAKGYDKEIQEAIKMASIAIQRHPNSKWVDDAYILVGRSRYYSLDWGNAIQTFKYTNTVSKDKNAKHLAIIHLIRTYIEHGEFNNAQAAIDFVQKAELSNYNKKKLLLEKAYFYQLRNDYDNMVRNLTQASPYLKKKDRRGRIYFIIGQVYQKLGFEAEAYNFYKKCLSTNPEYEVDFYARLYMAQVTEISRSKDVNAARKSFKKLLKDAKNKEFKDKIYYEMGVFELKQNNLQDAIENLNQSVREGSNKRIDGEAYLRLGEIYYDNLKKYELSQAYYDSAISALPKDYEGYAKIKTRQEILNEFVKHLKTIKWQDSLLVMATMDSAALRSKIDSALTQQKLLEEKRAKNKKRSNRIEIVSNNNNNTFENNDLSGSTGDWYFGNPSAMALGQTEFLRVWGNIALEDNWRRSLREATNNSSTSARTEETNAQTPSETQKEAEVKADPVDMEFSRLSKELPLTEEAKEEARKKIQEAYFKLGGIYYFKLEEDENAVATYKTLLRRFPETEYEPEALYTLYLILKDSASTEANEYAALLKSKFPSSTFAKILINPNYLQESGLAVEKQKLLYKSAYDHFQSEHYDSATYYIQQASLLGETAFTPTLNLLTILITGKTDDISKYQYQLDEFIKKNPNTDISTYAKKLLESSREFEKVQEKKKGIQYYHSLDGLHYFVVVYKKSDRIDETVSAALEHFNEANFNDLNLNTSNLVLNDEYSMTFVADIPGLDQAIEYYKTFNEKLPSLIELQNHKFDNFVITKNNFDIFYRTKGLDEYLQFFEKNYPAENP